MDGKTIVKFDGLGYQVGPDCLKGVLAKYGQEIYCAVKSAMGSTRGVG